MNLMSTLMLATNLLDERFFNITKKVVKKFDLVKGGCARKSLWQWGEMYIN